MVGVGLLQKFQAAQQLNKPWLLKASNNFPTQCLNPVMHLHQALQLLFVPKNPHPMPDASSTLETSAASTPATEVKRESVLITIIGSSIGLNLLIKILHRLGFAEIGAWSKPQVDPKTGQPMRILKKWIRV